MANVAEKVSQNRVLTNSSNDPLPKAEEEPWRQDLNQHLICPDCKENPPKLVEEFSSGDMVCGDCGLVLGDRIIDTRSEWRTFSNDDQNNDDPSRVGDGPNHLLNGEQLSTSIAFGDGSKAARELNRAQNKTSQDKNNRALLAAYKEIGTMCDSVQLAKNVSDTAKHLFKTVHDANVFRGKSQEVVIAGCIFIACRQCGAGRTFREIFKITKVPKKEIGRIFKALEKFFQEANASLTGKASMAYNIYPNILANETFAKVQTEVPNMNATSAAELCIRFTNQLGLSAQITKCSQELAAKMGSVGALAGRSPLSAAAACIFFISHLMGVGKPAKDIATVAGVSDGTIRTSYKLLKAEAHNLVEPKWLLPPLNGDISRLPKD